MIETVIGFIVNMQHHRSYRDLLVGLIPKEDLSRLPRSFDIIGEVAIIQLPEQLLKVSKYIGEAILKVHKNVKCVYAKVGTIKGKFRLPHLLHIAGEQIELTTHKEYGLSFLVDVKRCYFSPRLANEHRRIALLAKDGEYVIDMFSGVGPFAIHIASVRKALVYAIDINPYAYRCLIKNIRLNKRKLKGAVVPICSDSRVVAEYLRGIANRVIMNFPDDPYSFLEHALLFLNDEGVIHVYSFENEPDPIALSLSKIRSKLTSLGWDIIDVLYSRIVKEVSPKRRYIVLDLYVKRKR